MPVVLSAIGISERKVSRRPFMDVVDGGRAGRQGTTEFVDTSAVIGHHGAKRVDFERGEAMRLMVAVVLTVTFAVAGCVEQDEVQCPDDEEVACTCEDGSDGELVCDDGVADCVCDED